MDKILGIRVTQEPDVEKLVDEFHEVLEDCKMTTHINPWNEAYRLAAGKQKSTTQITMLRKPDGTLTADLQETLKHMLEHFAPEDDKHDDSDLHKQARTLSMELIYMEDDKEITAQEIRNAVANLGKKGTRRRHHGGNLQRHI